MTFRRLATLHATFAVELSPTHSEARARSTRDVVTGMVGEAVRRIVNAKIGAS